MEVANDPNDYLVGNLVCESEFHLSNSVPENTAIDNVIREHIGSTTGASDDWGDENTAPDRTYRWSPPVAGNYTIKVDATSGSDLNPSLRMVNSSTCTDISNHTSGEVSRWVEPGAWVIVADGVDATEGNYRLSIQLCKATEDLGTATGLVVENGDTTLEENDYGNNYRDKVYAWRAPATADYVFNTDDSEFNTKLRILDVGCTSLAVDSDSGEGNKSKITQTVQAGEYRIIVVDGEGTNTEGPFQLSITQ